MNKKGWKVLFVLIIPIMLMSAFYFSNYMISYSEQQIYESTRNQRAQATAVFARNIDKLVSDGFTWEDNRAMYNQMVYTYVNMMMLDDSVYITLLDNQLQRCIAFFGVELGNVNVFEDERNRVIITEAIEESNGTGIVKIWIEDEKIGFYFHSIPMEDVKYWIMIGVNREVVVASLDLSNLRWPGFVLVGLFAVAILDSIWQRITKVKRR